MCTYRINYKWLMIHLPHKHYVLSTQGNLSSVNTMLPSKVNSLTGLKFMFIIFSGIPLMPYLFFLNKWLSCHKLPHQRCLNHP